MRKWHRLFSVCTLILLLFTTILTPPQTVLASGEPRVDLIVTPSANEYILNADSEVEGMLNINIKPEGTITKKDREPIDVAFVYDTSGSMDDYLDNKKKAKSAKEALASALSYFGNSDNKVAGDNFYFIPFNDNVRTSGNVKVVEGLNNIQGLLNHLESNNTGGTNYTQTLEYAKNKLNQSKNKNKYIIFLTDGEPTVLNDNNKKYILYTNGTALYNGWTSRANYELARNKIHNVALKTSEELAKSNITMYSVGFAKEEEIDFRLLENMSTKTGGTAVRATTSNLTNIFQEISKKIDSYTISGEVSINLTKFNGDVEVAPHSNIVVDDNGTARIPFKFTFPVGKNPDPSSIITSLPLIFKKANVYTFDNIQLQYDGLSTPKVHSTITITVKKDMNSVPGAQFHVEPSAEKFIKPPSGNAKGNIDIEVTPKGMAPKDERLPIDVVFVHDTSGSMAEKFDGTRKDTTAKNALNSALDYFTNQSKEGDNFFFVPFDSDVSYKNIYEYGLFGKRIVGSIAPTSGLPLIKSSVRYLDYSKDYIFFTESASIGGTNYNAAITEATRKFILGTNRNKYIVFLTDGEPTALTFNNDKYEIFTNNTAKKNDKDASLTDVKKVIYEQALNISDTIGKSGITMYSIGFAQEGEVDFELLRNMSSKTGGYAVQGKSSNLTNIFDDISKKVNASSITGTVAIDLKKYEGKVVVDPDSNFKADSNQVVKVPFNITFPVGEKPSPSLIQQSLPLQFKEVGTYEFSNNVVMSYNDISGNRITLEHDPFTVIIEEETAPYFLNEVEIIGNKQYTPDSLVKLGNTDSETNEFTVKYKLLPETVFTEITSGKINNIKITQPLFDGISLANSSQIALYKNGQPIQGATVSLINGGKDVEINLGANAITYTSGSFSVDEFTIHLKLKANWALPYTLMPQAHVSFYDSRFKEITQSLNTDEQRISMTVQLPSSDSRYIGEYTGEVSKQSTDNALLAKTVLTDGNGPIRKPVKGMKLVHSGRAIEVSYYDNTKTILYLKTDFKLKNLSLSEDLQSGDTTKGRVGFKITDYVAGDEVIYEYQLNAKGSDTKWQEFDPTTFIDLPKELEGEIEIRVRTKGGFSLNSDPVVKHLTIIKESISVQPNPIELLVGDTIQLDIKIEPEDETEREFDVVVRDTAVARYENGKLTGLKDGQTMLEVSTVDIAGNEIKAEIPVKVNPVLITSIRVTPNPLSLGKHLDFNNFIVAIEPENASNKELIWNSLSSSIVRIEGQNRLVGSAKIHGLSTGTAQIEIKATDGSDVSTTITVVVGNPLTGIEVRNPVVIEKGATDENVEDYFNYLPSDATNIKGEPQFESTNENILVVMPDGDMIPRVVGEAGVNITVQDEDNNKYTAKLEVKVVEKGSNDKNQGDKY